MDFGAIAQSIWNQIVTVWHAPVPFIAVILLVAWVIWRVVQHEHATRLANAHSTIELLKERLGDTEVRETMAIAAATQAPSQPTTKPRRAAPRRATPQAKPAGPRVFVREDMTPEYIMSLFESRTDLQVKSIVEDQIGKWMRVRGRIKSVIGGISDDVMVGIHVAPVYFIFCTFSERTPYLQALIEGDEIELVGQLASVSNLGVYLRNCEVSP